MTLDDIVRMAREAGFYVTDDGILEGGDDDGGLELFAYLVAEAEREACAKICESLITEGDPYPANFVLETCAKTIRARNE